MPGIRTKKPAQSLDTIPQKIGSTLGSDWRSVKVDRWRFSGELPSILHCRGSLTGRRFFAKIFLADPYPVAPHVPLPWQALPADKQTRSVGDQIEAEWSMTNEFRLLAAPSSVPAPLAKSKTARTIVWEEVMGVRLDQFVKRSRWLDPQGRAGVAALFEAGAWLRIVHDASIGGQETVDVTKVIEIVQHLTQEEGRHATKYGDCAHQLLERAFSQVGREGKITVPVALSHGDFSLSNLMWDKKLNQLFVLDFEHSDRRNICHDLVSIIFDFRFQLLNPLIPKRVILSLEKSFWAGYGSVPKEVSGFVNAVASARIFYHTLPRLSTRRRRQGWLAGINASIYRTFFEDFVITQRLDACISPRLG